FYRWFVLAKSAKCDGVVYFSGKPYRRVRLKLIRLDYDKSFLSGHLCHLKCKFVCIRVHIVTTCVVRNLKRPNRLNLREIEVSYYQRQAESGKDDLHCFNSATVAPCPPWSGVAKAKRSISSWPL